MGYGSTGPGVKLGMKITQEEADRLLARDVATAAKGVDRMVGVPLTPSQRAALISLAFNIGLGNLRSSTLLRLLNGGDYLGASEQFDRWAYARQGGKPAKMAGLVRRRAAERELFETLPWL